MILKFDSKFLKFTKYSLKNAIDIFHGKTIILANN